MSVLAGCRREGVQDNTGAEPRAISGVIGPTAKASLVELHFGASEIVRAEYSPALPLMQCQNPAAASRLYLRPMGRGNPKIETGRFAEASIIPFLVLLAASNFEPFQRY